MKNILNILSDSAINIGLGILVMLAVGLAVWFFGFMLDHSLATQVIIILVICWIIGAILNIE